MKDFEFAFMQVRASVGTEDLDGYLQWNDKYGSMGTVVGGYACLLMYTTLIGAVNMYCM